MVLLIAVVAMALLAVRPTRRVPAWLWPLAGAVLLVFLGDEPAAQAWNAIVRQWNVLLFILGLMGLAAAAEESGAFAWITQVVLERAGGSRRRLFALLFAVAAVLTLLLSNDATVIVLAPLVYRVVKDRGGSVMPYLFACAFVANTASFGLPFSNPANVLILPNARLGAYLWQLGPPEIAAILLNLWILSRAFAPQLTGRYDAPPAGSPPPRALRALCAMGGVAIAYAVALLLRVPLGPVAAAGGCATLAIATVPLGAVRRHIRWTTFVLLAALFALLDAVSRAGFSAWAAAAIDDASRHGALALVAGATVGAALISNAFNNLPVAVAASYAVAHASSTHLAYALIAGVDLGPNLTTAGSLATILWLDFLRDHGIRMRAVEYLRVGAMVVPASLAVTILWLWLVR